MTTKEALQKVWFMAVRCVDLGGDGMTEEQKQALAIVKALIESADLEEA